MIDWNLVVITLPLTILAIGAVAMLTKKDGGPTERERILKATIDAMLEAQKQEISAKKETR